MLRFDQELLFAGRADLGPALHPSPLFPAGRFSAPAETAAEQSAPHSSARDASARRKPSRAVAAATPALTAATIPTKAFSRSSLMPAARAFSMRPRVHTWQPRVMVTARPIRCCSRSVSSEVWCVRARNSNTNAPSYPIVGLLYFVE